MSKESSELLASRLNEKIFSILVHGSHTITKETTKYASFQNRRRHCLLCDSIEDVLEYLGVAPMMQMIGAYFWIALNEASSVYYSIMAMNMPQFLLDILFVPRKRMLF